MWERKGTIGASIGSAVTAAVSFVGRRTDSSRDDEIWGRSATRHKNIPVGVARRSDGNGFGGGCGLWWRTKGCLSEEALARRTEVNEIEHPLWKWCGDRQSNFSGRLVVALPGPLVQVRCLGWLWITDIGRVTCGGRPDKSMGQGCRMKESTREKQLSRNRDCAVGVNGLGRAAAALAREGRVQRHGRQKEAGKGLGERGPCAFWGQLWARPVVLLIGEPARR